MTKDRMWGEDSDFTRWIRRHPLLPSASQYFGITVNDIDVILHRYKTIIDSIGTKEIQSIIHIQAKTRGATPDQSQADSLAKLNIFKGTKIFCNAYIRNMGVYCISFDGTCPLNSRHIWWGRFYKKDSSELLWNEISEETLLGLLRLDIHPDNFSKNPFRRHHKERKIVVEESTDLGFTSPKLLILRS